jgi:hypothetical protein
MLRPVKSRVERGEKYILAESACGIAISGRADSSQAGGAIHGPYTLAA